MPSPQPAYEHNGKPVSAEAFYAIACDPRRNVAVEACAGAGKTWMLVSRIVRALLDGAKDGHLEVQPHEILAITFTKRAASEMRERLYTWLAEFARADRETLVKELRDRGVLIKNDLQPPSNLPEKLSNLYQSMLATGRQVQIRTFHSWFAALLRSAPLAVLRQLELPASYELLEDDAPAKALVWRRFYAALAGQIERKADFEAVVFEHGRFQTEKALQIALDKRIEFSLADASGVVEDSVLHFTAQFPAFASLEEPMAMLRRESVRARWLGWARSLAQESNKTPQKAATSIIDSLAVFDAADGSSPSAHARALALLCKGFFVSDEDRLTQHLKKFEAAQAVEGELQLLCAAQRQHEAWLYQQRMARLTRVLMAEYAALKRERGWVDMNDVERAAGVMLGDAVLSGWVQQRLDARVRHLLIDEFQDTNPLQWQALLSWLSGYSGSGGGGQAPSVFIVGDPKQSIYRFRRAEPQVFRAAQQFVAQGLVGDLLNCDHTRRNAGEVIATVNAAMGAAREEDHYAGFREHTTSSAEAGVVCRLPPVPRPEKAEKTDKAGNGDIRGADGAVPDPTWRDSLTLPREVPEETLRTLEARQAAAWIAQQLAAGLEPADVMVLSRKRAGLTPLQDELRALHIAARIGEKTELIDCCEVQDVVALLDVLVSPQHDLSLARVLKSPLFGLGDDALVQLALAQRQANVPWFELLQKTELLTPDSRGVSAYLMRWKEWLDCLPPHDALQAIYHDGDVLARFAMAAPATQRGPVLANLRALLGVSLQLGGGRYATPYSFVRALKAGGVQAPAAVTGNAVRLLTIHGAKGLEAQAVLLLDTDTVERNAETMGVLVDWPGEAAQPDKFVFLASENRPPACAVATLAAEQVERQREELNALYVALTRARHTLAISSIEPHRETGRSWWQRLTGLVAEVAVVTSGPAGGAAGSGAGNHVAAPFYLKELPVATVIKASDATKSEANAAMPEEDSAAARVGKAMHRLLEWGDVSTQNRAAVAREFALSAEQGVQAAAMARRILQGAGAWAWDAAVVGWQGNEVELLYQGETLRLDRLVQRKDSGQWWVLDYKSAQAPQARPALVGQLQTYRAAVQAIYPGASVKAAFLTAQGALVEVKGHDGP